MSYNRQTKRTSFLQSIAETPRNKNSRTKRLLLWEIHRSLPFLSRICPAVEKQTFIEGEFTQLFIVISVYKEMTILLVMTKYFSSFSSTRFKLKTHIP